MSRKKFKMRNDIMYPYWLWRHCLKCGYRYGFIFHWNWKHVDHHAKMVQLEQKKTGKWLTCVRCGGRAVEDWSYGNADIVMIEETEDTDER
jgi:hypothetical protein